MHYISVVRKGDRLRLRIAGLDEEAAGWATVGEIRVHVAGALVDEEVEVTVGHLSPHRPSAWAQLDAVLRPSSLRVPPACAAYGDCGGCTLEHLTYAAQVAWKGERVGEELARQGLDLAVEPCVPSPRPLGYRNKTKLVYAADEQRRGRLGAYAPRSHRVVGLDGCQVVEPPLDELTTALRGLLTAREVVPYDERRGEGQLRYAISRVNHRRQVLLTLVTAAAPFVEGEPLAQALMTAHPTVVGVVQNINRSRGNVLYGDEERCLAGQAHLVDRVGEVQLRLSSTAFFQVNREVAARLYADLRQAAALHRDERVIDAYAGVGGIALTLAADAGEVIGIEEHARAVADASASAELNGIGNARFIAADAGAALAELGSAAVVVLNPPRRGCSPEVLQAVASLRPRLVAYVSCAPDTLARDLTLLGRHGLVARRVTPYDMLPQTPHVESLALLTPP